MASIAALGIALGLSLGQYAPQQAGSEPLEPALEARVQKIGKELRCAVCQGLAITDSPASMARAQLDKLRELVRAGKSDEEIKAYFVARYGEWVLLKPNTGGTGGLVWLLPMLVALGGLGIVAYYVFLHRRRPAPAPGASAPAVPAPAAPEAATDDDYLRAVKSELDR